MTSMTAPGGEIISNDDGEMSCVVSCVSQKAGSDKLNPVRDKKSAVALRSFWKSRKMMIHKKSQRCFRKY